jgi:hypothetical protein
MVELTMTHRTIRLFLVSVATVLFLTAAAKLYSATETVRLLATTNPFLYLTNRAIMIAAGPAEAAIALWPETPLLIPSRSAGYCSQDLHGRTMGIE